MVWDFVLTWIHIGVGLLILGVLRRWGKAIWSFVLDIAGEVLRHELEKRQQKKDIG